MYVTFCYVAFVTGGAVDIVQTVLSVVGCFAFLAPLFLVTARNAAAFRDDLWKMGPLKGNFVQESPHLFVSLDSLLSLNQKYSILPHPQPRSENVKGSPMGRETSVVELSLSSGVVLAVKYAGSGATVLGVIVHLCHLLVTWVQPILQDC